MEFLQQLQIQAENPGTSTGREWIAAGGPVLESWSPVDGRRIAVVISTDKKGYERVVETPRQAFTQWRSWPAPRRAVGNSSVK